MTIYIYNKIKIKTYNKTTSSPFISSPESVSSASIDFTLYTNFFARIFVMLGMNLSVLVYQVSFT